METSTDTLITPASTAAIARAGAILRAGGLVAFATETVYGLGADATNDAAVARIFEAKGRPRFNPLIVHVTGLEQALEYGEFSETALLIAQRFWPGPLTLVLPERAGARLSALAVAGLGTVALRVPDNREALELIAAAGRPLAAPSANRSGRVSPTTAAHVAADLGKAVDMILDSGPCRAGIESTIVAVQDGGGVLLRPGAVPREAIEALTGPLQRPGGEVAAPGMLKSHYAPRARLRLNAAAPEAGEPFLAFGPRAAEGPGVLNLSPSGDLAEAAANLFAYLRRLDEHGAECIAVAPIPAAGLGEAINDRLRRAAAPRHAV